MINKLSALGMFLFLSGIAIGEVPTNKYSRTFLVETRSENKIQSEACAEATMRNMSIADFEFGDDKYLLVKSDKKLSYSDSETFKCEVTILWGVIERISSNQLTIQHKTLNTGTPEKTKANDGKVSLALGQILELDIPSGYKSLTGQYLTGTYTTSNDIGYRLTIHNSRLNYRFEENGQSKKTKTYEGIGIGIERPIIKQTNLKLLARVDIVESVPFSQTLKTGEENSITKKIEGARFISFGLPVKYQWRDVFFSAQLSRVLISEDKKLHPYNFGFEFGYQW